MTEQYQAWWETAGIVHTVSQLRKYPMTVIRQVEVACDMAMAPVGSDQETFPTLSPEEAEKLLKQEKTH